MQRLQMARKNPLARNSEANGDHNFSRIGQVQSWPIHTASTVKLMMTTISRQNLVFTSCQISIRDDASIERSESSFKAILRNLNQDIFCGGTKIGMKICGGST